MRTAKFLAGCLGLVPTLLLAEPADRLVYQVWESGGVNYISRVLVTPDHVRLDEGGGVGSAYTLFDRHRGVLYNVLPGDHSVLVMDPRDAVPPMPADLRLETRVSTDLQAPAVAGRQPQNLELLANGDSCARVVAVPGMLPDAVVALRELRAVLARIQAATALRLPGGIGSPCEMAELVYAPDRDLAHGLPIQFRSDHRTQSLVDFTPGAEVQDGLFRIPADYQRMDMPGLAAP